jgi:uncharacterized protein YidB (DUF937 family)
MGLLDSVLGSVLGGGSPQGGAGSLINVVAGMLANSGQAAGGGGAGGGLAGLVEQFERGGLGHVMNSWIGTGQNLPISADQLGGVLGGNVLGQLTQQTGMSQGDLLGQLAQVLPQVVEKLTPNGSVPSGGLGDIGAILGQLTGAR